ncbi:MAG: AMIN domain-containing protein [Candidatus Aminicenantes bacterium]|nr:AMIN domain-containing protein [Candidatus Aminicenantes bacterium]
MKRGLIGLSLLTLITFSMFGQVPESKEIKSISYQIMDDQLKVLIEFEKGISYESLTIMNPNRLVIDFPQVSGIAVATPIEVNKMGVLTIRSGKPDPTVTRIVFDLDIQAPLFKIEDVEQGIQISFWQEEIEEPILEKVEEEKPPVEVPAKITEPEKPAEKKKEEVKPEAKKAEPTEKKPAVPPAKSTARDKFTIGPFAGFYFMQDEVFTEIYGSSSFLFGAQYSLPIPPIQGFRGLNIWFAFSSQKSSGQTTFFEEDITLKMMDVSLALRYSFDLNKFSPFIGFGIDYITFKETYPEDFPVSSTEGSETGFHIQGGTLFHITPFLAAKAFFKYNMAETYVDDIRVNLGGTQWAIGILYRFNL